MVADDCVLPFRQMFREGPTTSGRRPEVTKIGPFRTSAWLEKSDLYNRGSLTGGCPIPHICDLWRRWIACQRLSQLKKKRATRLVWRQTKRFGPKRASFSFKPNGLGQNEPDLSPNQKVWRQTRLGKPQTKWFGGINGLTAFKLKGLNAYRRWVIFKEYDLKPSCKELTTRLW
jgi:hypothetical protein